GGPAVAPGSSPRRALFLHMGERRLRAGACKVADRASTLASRFDPLPVGERRLSARDLSPQPRSVGDCRLSATIRTAPSIPAAAATAEPGATAGDGDAASVGG